VDAKTQLRRYLEQRRDMGESEYLLDSMSVEEALHAIGVIRAGTLKQRPRPVVPNDPAQATPESVKQASQPVTQRRPIPADADAFSEAGVDEDATESVEQPPADPRPRVGQGTEQSIAQGIEQHIEQGEDVPRVKFTPGLVVGSTEDSLFQENPFKNVKTLDGIAKLVHKCTRCDLYKTALNGVPGEGDPNADMMCVGEAPGANEDETGRPFIGAAGQLLTKILAAIDIQREEVFIANVLKHRPPGNRNPKPDEVAACSPYLVRQIELIKPKVIVAFGTFAAQTLLETKTPIGKLRSMVHRYYGVPLIVTYHPAALLRNPAWKRSTWEDVKLARKILDSATK
jgi:uracil-DNA glycosylase